MAFPRKISMFCVMYCNLVTHIVYNISNLLKRRETIDMFTTFWPHVFRSNVYLGKHLSAKRPATTITWYRKILISYI